MTPLKRVLAGFTWLMLGSLAGCGSSRTEQPVWMPPAATPAAPALLSPQPSPQATAEFCFNDAAFLEDLTLPDGSQVGPGETLDKRWSVLNNGTCDWGPEYRLVRTGEDQLAGVEEQALYPARAGEQAIWQVYLMAPPDPGQYESQWRAMSPEGIPFGDSVFVVVVVGEKAASRATVVPTPGLIVTSAP